MSIEVLSLPPWKALAIKLGVHGLAGLVAGAIGLGLLTFRGVMRLLTLTSGRPGLPTENGAIAGDFTVDGTLFLVIAGGVLGMVIGLLIGTVRSGFPGTSSAAMLLFTPLLARVLIVHPDNIDFVRFGPAWVAVAGFTAGIAIYLFLLGSLVDRLGTKWRLPRPVLIAAGGVSMGFLVLGLATSGSTLIFLVTLALIGILVGGNWARTTWHLPLARAMFWVLTIGGTVTWVQATIKIL